MSGVRFVRLYPSDWRSGCIGLTLEQEGLYIRVCTFIFETERRLPIDDGAAAKFMGLHTNAYRKVRDQLAAIGKLTRHEDGWTVARAERELAAASYQKREAERQADQNTPGDTRQDTLGDTPPDTPPDTPQESMGVFSKKQNEINGPLKSLSHSHNQREESTTVHSESEAAREDGRTDAPADLKSAFNGSTETMLAFVELAMGPNSRANAIAWLTATTSAHGSVAVAQAFASLAEKRAAGEVITRPLPLWSSIAAGMKAGRPSKQREPTQREQAAAAFRAEGKRRLLALQAALEADA